MAKEKETKNQRADARQAGQKTRNEKEAKAKAADSQSKGSELLLAVGALIVIVAIGAVAYFFVIPSFGGVPFSTFKSNFQSAPRIAVAVAYKNQSQFVEEVPCYGYLLEVVSGTRNVSTIDFMLINQTTQQCVYSPTGLGASESLQDANASACIEIANNEPSVFLNYSSYNSSRITSDHLYIGADSEYMAKCPIASEFS